MDDQMVFTPILNCEHQDENDGCCHHPKNSTPECHIFCCPKLTPAVGEAFNKSMAEQGYLEHAIKAVVDDYFDEERTTFPIFHHMKNLKAAINDR